MASRGIIELSSKNFSRSPNNMLLLNIPEMCLVLFKQQGCPHCTVLEPVFSKLAATDNRVLFCFADISRDRQIHKLSKDSNVQINSVPTMYFYAGGKPAARYKGERNLNSISRFITNVINDIKSNSTFMQEQQRQYKPQPMLYNMEYKVPVQQIQHHAMDDRKLLMPDNVNPYNTPWELSSQYNKLG